jgi:hypothetical protein
MCPPVRRCFTYRRLPAGAPTTEAPLVVGIYEVTATFAGNESHTAASAVTTIVINEPPAITTVTGSR